MVKASVIVQEISDDVGRHRSDAQVNGATVTVLRGHEEVQSQWKHLQPGDLVKVSLLLLQTVFAYLHPLLCSSSALVWHPHGYMTECQLSDKSTAVHQEQPQYLDGNVGVSRAAVLLVEPVTADRTCTPCFVKTSTYLASNHRLCT